MLQRVCRSWNDAIASSVKLQTAMFLRPAGNKIREATYLINPLKETCRVCKVGVADRLDDKIYRGHTHDPADDERFNSYIKDLKPPTSNSAETTAYNCSADIAKLGKTIT